MYTEREKSLRVLRDRVEETEKKLGWQKKSSQALHVLHHAHTHIHIQNNYYKEEIG